MAQELRQQQSMQTAATGEIGAVAEALPDKAAK